MPVRVCVRVHVCVNVHVHVCVWACACAYVRVNVRAVDGDGREDVLHASSQDNTVAWHQNVAGPPVSFVTYIITSEARGAWSVKATDGGFPPCPVPSLPCRSLRCTHARTQPNVTLTED